MDLTVIVPARNEERHLREQLVALAGQDWEGEWEVIVADNGSTDDTAEIVTSFASTHPRFRLLRVHERPDKCFAVNRAAESSSAPLLAFTDADDVVAPGWLAAVADGLARHPVVTGPNHVDRLNPPHLADSRGRSGEGPSGTFFGLFPCVRGNNFGVRSETWRELGGLTEGLKACEDTEFSLRCWLGDIEIVGLPAAVVHYRYRSDTRSLWRQGVAYGTHRPLIVRLLVAADRPRPPRFAGWRSWLALMFSLPTLLIAERRQRWVWIAANRYGQLVGSVRYRTLFL